MTDDESVFDESLSDLFHAEQHKEITQITLLQAQTMSLMAILHRKGILSREELKEVDDLAAEMQHHLIRLYRAANMEGDGMSDDEAEQIAHEAAESAAFLAEYLPPTGEKERVFNESVDGLRDLGDNDG